MADPFLGVPQSPDLKVEQPDGVLKQGETQSTHSLYDTGGTRPPLTSGDWDVRPPSLGRRGRP